MGYSIPLFDLNYDKREEDAIISTLKEKWISSGPKCEELERRFADALGVKYALTVSSCTSALHIALLCAGIQPGDEVIVPSLTFVATANAIRYVGASPVFCDIESLANPTIDPAEIEKLINKKTKAIIVMHYGGFPCAMDRIVELANKYEIKIIEDACHAPMVAYAGKMLGSIGMIGCFSFFSNKNISIGEGGMLVTDDERVYEKAKLLRSHGMTVMSYQRATGHALGYDVVELGYNYRLDDIHAALGIVQLTKLKEDLKRRSKIRKKYLLYLQDFNGVLIPFLDYEGSTSNYIFPIFCRADVSERDRLRSYLKDNGVQTSMHYPPVHQFSIYQSAKRGKMSVTEEYCNGEITLPMYAALSDEHIEYITNLIKKGLMRQ